MTKPEEEVNRGGDASVIDSDSSEQPVRSGLLWKDLSVSSLKGASDDKTTTSTTTLLYPFSGFVPNGHVCAILGPSGSGKTTFLSALAGRSRHLVQGTINYYPPPSASSSTKGNTTTPSKQPQSSPDPSQVAWLSQVDHFFSLLTPRETLQLAAFLELPHWKNSDRQALVRRQLESLGLLHVADHSVGSSTDSMSSTTSLLQLPQHQLSGGERRRLSVALELLTQDQWYLLADEPTSGLDTSLAVTVLKLLQRQTQQQNIPTIASLHQPRSLVWHSLIDYVVLIAPGGLVCYSGPKDDILPYFAQMGYPCPDLTNPAEFLVDLVSIRNKEYDDDELGGGEEEESQEGDDDRKRIAFLAQSFADYQLKQSNDLEARPTRQLSNQNGRKEPHEESLSSSSSSSSFVPSRASRRSGSLLRLLHFLLLTPLQRGPSKLRLWLSRSCALWRRSWRQNIRNRPLHVFRFLASVGNALLLSKVFPSVVRGSPPLSSSMADRVALLSFGAINMAFMAFMKAVTIFAEERVRCLGKRDLRWL